jgi:hypothetical protein
MAPLRRVGIADGDLAEALGLVDMCPQAVALEKGTEFKHLVHHNERFVGERGGFGAWLDEIAHVEAGWINFHSKPGGHVELYWVSPASGEEVSQGPIYYGEPKTHWRVVYIGHKFRVRDPTTKALVREMDAVVNECFILGTQPPLEAEFKKPRDRTAEFKATNEYETRRSHNVKRTFTEVN